MNDLRSWLWVLTHPLSASRFFMHYLLISALLLVFLCDCINHSLKYQFSHKMNMQCAKNINLYENLMKFNTLPSALIHNSHHITFNIPH